MNREYHVRKLTEAKDRVWEASLSLPAKFRKHAETIDRKLIDLIENLRSSKK